MALQGRDQFHPPGTVFMHDYVGFCAQPVWPALGKKKSLFFQHIVLGCPIYPCFEGLNIFFYITLGTKQWYASESG